MMGKDITEVLAAILAWERGSFSLTPAKAPSKRKALVPGLF